MYLFWHTLAGSGGSINPSIGSIDANVGVNVIPV